LDATGAPVSALPEGTFGSFALALEVQLQAQMSTKLTTSPMRAHGQAVMLNARMGTLCFWRAIAVTLM
jgi:hypothetical protein